MNDRKNNNNERPSRRTFVKLGLVSGALAAMGKITFPGKTTVKPKESPGEKVKMLTPDGRLVEVDKSVIEASKKQKATNTEIRDFVDHRKNQKS